VVSDLVAPHPYPWYQLTVALLMGLLGLPLAYGLLRKRVFAFPLVHAMFGLSLLLAAIRLSHVMRRYSDPGEKSSGLFAAALLLMSLLSVVYYQRRKAQFH
jgi:uncharacterized membrane protein